MRCFVLRSARCVAQSIQAMKLWDLRMMMTPSDYEAMPVEQKHMGLEWDYR